MSQRWTLSQAGALFEKPLLELLFEAQQVHRGVSTIITFAYLRNYIGLSRRMSTL